MFVYVVIGILDYEGDFVIAVFSTEEKAYAFIEPRDDRGRFMGYDSVVIERHEIDIHAKT